MRGDLLIRGAHASPCGSCLRVSPEIPVRRDFEYHTRDAYAPRSMANRSQLAKRAFEATAPHHRTQPLQAFASESRLILRAIADLEPVTGGIFEEHSVIRLGVFMAGTFDISRTDLPEHVCDFIDFGHA
jgi:hypothetical protein